MDIVTGIEEFLVMSSPTKMEHYIKVDFTVLWKEPNRKGGVRRGVRPVRRGRLMGCGEGRARQKSR